MLLKLGHKHIDSQIGYSVGGIERIAFADANYAYDLAGHADKQ